MKGIGELNDEQRDAVLATPGPTLIMAGPGTGKTKTLTARIAHLIEQGISSDQILALTFTNKAAREMQSRVQTLLPAGKAMPVITTFHGFCFQLLKEFNQSPPQLISEVERQQILRDIKKSITLKGLSLRELSLRLSLMKSSFNTQQDSKENENMLQKYQEILTGRNLYDFDDLLVEAYNLIRRHDDKIPVYQHILVDEFQDTNGLQYELLKELNRTDNLFVIGDPLQSIYGFRGAEVEVFDRFKGDWPNAKPINLTINYRSAPEVVRLGRAIFPSAVALRAHRQGAGKVHTVEVLNEYSEARWIVEAIEQSIGGSTMLRGHDFQDETRSTSFRDFAILYRTHRTAQVLKRLLDESGLPYQIAGEGSPYMQPAIAAIVDALRAVEPSRDSVSKLLTDKAKGFGFNSSSSEIRAIINAAVRFDDVGLEAYLKHLDTIAEQEFYDPSADAVTLLTIHAAKGLEFDHVFLVGAEDGILPHRPPKGEPNFDEERRLFYVAVTRACNNLDILHTKKRAGQASSLSVFARDIPSDVLPRLIDPSMQDQKRRLQIRAAKKAQRSLF